MNPLLFNILVFTSLYFFYKYYNGMAGEETNKPSAQEQEKTLFDPDNLMVNIGGKQVPFNKINKPHHVVLDPSLHKPKVDVASFPDLEPEAKQREAELAAARAGEKAKKDE
ncbi:hypothetical protein G9P44_003247 [Scheffersomyces stipitis]|nr:hypothetical protein G9P44_003247 [Scheffersomyces stipitis]